MHKDETWPYRFKKDSRHSNERPIKKRFPQYKQKVHTRFLGTIDHGEKEYLFNQRSLLEKHPKSWCGL